MLETSMVVSGGSIGSLGGRRYEVVNPANGERVGSAPRGDASDADMAIASAAAALGRWRGTASKDRAELFARAVCHVREHVSALSHLLTLEQGKPLHESSDEIVGFAEKMSTFARIARQHRDGRVPFASGRHESDADRIAEGVTVGLIAWNFPVGLMAKIVGPTLLGGGTVVVKPAATTPLTSSRVIALMNEGGLPPGVLSCVTGHGDEVGEPLVTSDAVTRVHVMGSDETGARVKSLAARDSRRVRLDLSGSDAMVVCGDAYLPAALRAAIVGRFRNAGQMCVAVKRLYLHTRIYAAFMSRLIDSVSQFELGSGLVAAIAPAIRLGPVHTSDQSRRLGDQLSGALQQGSKVLVGGGPPRGQEFDRGHFFRPTLVINVPSTSPLVREEVFGPILPVFEIRDLDDAVAQVKQSPWHGNVSLWTNGAIDVPGLRADFGCRRLWVNRLPFGVSCEHPI